MFQRTGKIADAVYFDAEAFGMTDTQSDELDYVLRKSLEVAFEAILDSGKCKKWIILDYVLIIDLFFQRQQSG